MYRPYGDDPNQELYAGEVSTKPLTEKERAAIQLKLRTQAAMAKPPAGLAQLANNALSDPSIQAIMYLLGLPETVMTSLAAAVRNPGALPAGDLAKATWDRLQKGYTYADLYKSSGMNPQAADIAGLAASITSPVGDKATAVRAAQGAMKAGADALAAAGNAGIIGKNAVAQTLMDAGYPAGAAARAEERIATGLGAGKTGLTRPIYWDTFEQDAWGPWHALGREGFPVKMGFGVRKYNALSPADFEEDLGTVKSGIDWLKAAQRQGGKIYIYRSAPGQGQATTNHGNQGSQGTFFHIDPHIAASYAVGSASKGVIVEAALDPKKIFVVEPKVIVVKDQSVLDNAKVKDTLEYDLIQAKETLRVEQSLLDSTNVIEKALQDFIKSHGERYKALASGKSAMAIPPDILKILQSIPSSSHFLLPPEISVAPRWAIRFNTLDRATAETWLAAMQPEKAKLIASVTQMQIKADDAKKVFDVTPGFTSKELIAKGGDGSRTGVRMLATPQWEDVADKAWKDGYDAIFNPATGEIVVSNVPRGKQGSAIERAMQQATVKTNFKDIGVEYPQPGQKPDLSRQYPLGYDNRTQEHWDDNDFKLPSMPAGFFFQPPDPKNPTKNVGIDWKQVWDRFYAAGATTKEAADLRDAQRQALGDAINQGQIPYSLWWEITQGETYDEYLKRIRAK